MKAIQLKALEGLFSVYKLNTEESIPSSVYQSNFFSITKSDEELSIVCPENSSLKTDQASHHWRCIKIIGPLDFSLIGIINQITSILKEAQISVFVISTFTTDYFLIKEDQFDKAILELKRDKAIQC